MGTAAWIAQVAADQVIEDKAALLRREKSDDRLSLRHRPLLNCEQCHIDFLANFLDILKRRLRACQLYVDDVCPKCNIQMTGGESSLNLALINEMRLYKIVFEPLKTTPALRRRVPIQVLPRFVFL